MAKEIKKQEEYEIGKGNVKITTYSGDANHSDITIELEGETLVNGENAITDFDLGTKKILAGKNLKVFARISKTSISDHISFSVELDDELNSRDYLYHSLEVLESIIKYEVSINLKNE